MAALPSCGHRKTALTARPETCLMRASADATRSSHASVRCRCRCRSSRCGCRDGWASKSLRQTVQSPSLCRPHSSHTGSCWQRPAPACRNDLPARASPSATDCCSPDARHCVGWRPSTGAHGAHDQGCRCRVGLQQQIALPAPEKAFCQSPARCGGCRTLCQLLSRAHFL